MTRLIDNLDELLQQSKKCLGRPAVGTFYAHLVKWLKGLHTESDLRKQQVNQWKEEPETREILRKQLRKLEEFNEMLLIELDKKTKEIEYFACEGGVNLTNGRDGFQFSFSNKPKSLQVTQPPTNGKTQSLDTQKLLDAIKALRQGVPADTVAKLSGLDAGLLERIAVIIR